MENFIEKISKISLFLLKKWSWLKKFRKKKISEKKNFEKIFLSGVTSGVFVCNVKTRRLLETNRYFKLDPEPQKALQSPLLRTKSTWIFLEVAASVPRTRIYLWNQRRKTIFAHSRWSNQPTVVFNSSLGEPRSYALITGHSLTLSSASTSLTADFRRK